MLDHRLFLGERDQVLARLAGRGVDAGTIDTLARLADERRALIQRVEGLRRALNEASAAVSEKAKAGDQEAVAAAREQLKGLKAEIKEGEQAQADNEQALQGALLLVPNLPHDSVPQGADESGNEVLKVVGERTRLDTDPLPHWEIGERLGILDFEAAAKISGARFVVYRGAGARLERALINFMLDLARENGHLEIAPPILVRLHAMEGAAQYPKFEGESFETQGREFALIPTSEVPLVNLHRDEILAGERLPVRYAAYTPCFRREAGAAGKDTRGLIRQHQFNKVELVAFTDAESSFEELEHLTAAAESVLERLELPYRRIALCTGDMGFASAKTYDLEVWLPGQDTYREISSCSNCTDFQARRAKIRYRPAGDPKAKPQLVHTLNGSGIAVGRTVVALLENGLRADGTVKLPSALVPYFGAAVIEPEA